MVTVPEVTATIIKRSRYLSEALAKDIINISSLARYIKPEIEQMLLKNVSKGSVIMAIKRLKTELKPQSKYRNIFPTKPEMITRSDLVLISILNSETLYETCSAFFKKYPIQRRHFFALIEGFSETTLIMSHNLKEKINSIFEKETITYEKGSLSSITIQLPKEAPSTPGVLYFFLKSLAWEQINVVEIVSTSFELTLIFEDREIDKAFTLLKSLFGK